MYERRAAIKEKIYLSVNGKDGSSYVFGLNYQVVFTGPKPQLAFPSELSLTLQCLSIDCTQHNAAKISFINGGPTITLKPDPKRDDRHAPTFELEVN